jgi:hypothetical protein
MALLPFCRPARRPRYRVGLTYHDPGYPTRHQRYRVGHHAGPTLQDLPCSALVGSALARDGSPTRGALAQDGIRRPTLHGAPAARFSARGTGRAPCPGRPTYPTAGPILPPRTGPRPAARPRRSRPKTETADLPYTPQAGATRDRGAAP